MIKFKNYLDFEKLYINTGYIFDVSIEVNTSKIIDRQGKEYLLNNIIATKRNKKSEIEILLNVTENESEYYQIDVDQFKDSDILKTEIINYINDNINELSY